MELFCPGFLLSLTDFFPGRLHTRPAVGTLTMYRPATSLPMLRISASRWFVLAMIVCWAALSVPTSARSQPLAESALPGLDLQCFVLASDRTPSLQTGDHRHAATHGDGNPTQPMTGFFVAATAALNVSQPTSASIDDVTERQPHSPAQPRAPPARFTRSY